MNEKNFEHTEQVNVYAAQGLEHQKVVPIAARLGGALPNNQGSSWASDSNLRKKDVSSHGKLGTMLSEEESDSMPNFSREELNATLGQHKAEVNAIASEMRREMAEWREQSNTQLSQLTIAINAISSKIDGKMDRIDGEIKGIDGKIEGVNGKFEGIQNQISGINTAISGIQSGISSRLAIFGIILAVLVALPSLISVFKDSPQPLQAPSLPPVILQVPQTPPQVLEAPLTTPPTSKQSQ